MGLRQRWMQALAVGALLAVVLAPAAAAAAPTAPPTPPAADTPTTARQAWDAAVRSAPHAAPAPAGPRAGVGVAPAVATPTLTTAPDTALVSGQVVTATGTDLGTSDRALIQCATGVTPAFACDTRTLTIVRPDAGGAINVGFRVYRTIHNAGSPLDCSGATDACDLVVADLQANVLARHALAFDPNAPLPNPTITVTPADGLTAGQALTVTGSGFLPADFVRIGECVATDVYCSGSGSYVQTDGSGAFSTPLTARLRVDDGTGHATHCLAVACTIRATSDSDLGYAAAAPISFDPNQPLPPTPTITVVPSTGLHHDQNVTITGTGFDPAGYVQINECGTQMSTYCGEFLASTQADGAGNFSASGPVTRLVSRSLLSGPTIEDCAVVACTVTATEYSNDESITLSASAPIAFDDSVPPPPVPQVTVTPSTNLPYRTQVTVHGTGYTAGEYVSADFCAESTTDGSCPGYASGVADGNGTIDFALPVKRRAFSGGSTWVDCLDANTQCTVRVQATKNYEQSSTALSFDPNAPIPPAPTAAISPADNLGYRQPVALTGAGFTPGTVPVSECAQIPEGPGTFEDCAGFTVVDADASGAISTQFEIRRILRFGPGLSVDCGTNPTPCTLRVGSGDPDESAAIPLTFDPNAVPPPPPTVTVTPATHLHDGQPATVSGANFAANALVGMAPCKAGATAIADSCDIGRATIAMTGADGAFSTTVPMASVLGTAPGAVDCTTGPGACIWAVANAGDLSEFATTPLAFDTAELMIHSATVTEGTGAMTEAEVMVSISSPAGSPTTAEWRIVPGTAGPDDYMGGRGRVTIPAGATEGMIHIPIVGDALDEPTERFTVELSPAPGTVVMHGTATVKIRDDDAAPRIRVGDWHANEGDGVAMTIVGLSAPSGRTVTVDFRTRRDSATSSSDYVSTKGTVTFAPGQQWALVSVPLRDDQKHERTERFRIELSNAINGVLADDRANITIFDND